MKRQARLLIVLFIVAIAAPALTQEKGGADITGPYDVVTGWMKPAEEGYMLHPVAVFAENQDRIFIGSAGVTPLATAPKGLTLFDPKVPGAKLSHQLLVLDRNGKIVEDWSRWGDLFGSMHAVAINPYDPEKHIWIIDRASQQVFKFTHDGKQLVMSLGEKGKGGNDDKHFGRPTDIAWLPDGTFFVSDGYDNRRVVKFDKDGKFLMSWGSEGTGPGQFKQQVHGIAVDARRRVYVVDRQGGRVQIFDENGKYLDSWTGMLSPTRVQITQDQFAWVIDAGAQRLVKYDLNGKLITYWGTAGAFEGGMATPHGFTTDAEGTLYVSNGFNHRIDKYVPKKTADRSRLVGPSFVQGRTGTR